MPPSTGRPAAAGRARLTAASRRPGWPRCARPRAGRAVVPEVKMTTGVTVRAGMIEGKPPCPRPQRRRAAGQPACRRHDRAESPPGPAARAEPCGPAGFAHPATACAAASASTSAGAASRAWPAARRRRLSDRVAATRSPSLRRRAGRPAPASGPARRLPACRLDARPRQRSAAAYPSARSARSPRLSTPAHRRGAGLAGAGSASPTASSSSIIAGRGECPPLPRRGTSGRCAEQLRTPGAAGSSSPPPWRGFRDGRRAGAHQVEEGTVGRGGPPRHPAGREVQGRRDGHVVARVHPVGGEVVLPVAGSRPEPAEAVAAPPGRGTRPGRLRRSRPGGP